MDILFWKNLSPNIKIESSTKNFYKEYLYKLEVYAPGCKSIRAVNIKDSIEVRRQNTRDYNQGGSWWDRKMVKYLKEADVGFLISLSNLYYEYPDIKIRIEEPKISIYTVDETMMQSVAKSIDPDHKDKLLSLTGPENTEQSNLLKNNIILVKREPKFKYRVFFKEKQFEFIVRSQVFTYLEQMGDLVKMTDHTKESLTKPHNWIWGCYFYTNDRGVADMVRLIYPDIVKEVSEVVCLNNK